MANMRELKRMEIGEKDRFCCYCNEPIRNAPVIRGGMPLHDRCNAQLNHELSVWERETGLDEKEYDNV